MDVEVIVPALNEERRIQSTIGAVAEYLEHQAFSSAIVVVDNGSVDRTVEAASALSSSVPIYIIGCSDLGKGAAVRRGVLSSAASMIGFCDADLATPIEALDHCLPCLEQGDPIVIGSRRSEGATHTVLQPLIRRIGSWGFRQVVASIVPAVSDTQCGFKFFRGDVARELFEASTVDGFAFDVEILALARKAGYAITEIPVSWSSVPGSTFRILRDGWQAMSDTLALRRLLRVKASSSTDVG